MISSMLFSVALGFSANQVMVQDEACNFSIQHDLHVAEHEVVLRDNNEELWRVNRDGQLFVNGTQADTSRHQTQLLQQYQQGIYSQTQDLVVVVAEALDIANYAVSSVFNELLGGKADSKISKLQQAISAELDNIVQQQDEYLVIRGSELDALGDNLDSVIDEEMEALIAESMGSVLMQVGKAMMFGSGSMDERIASFEERMESMGERVEAEVEARAEKLEARAEGMCQQVQTLASIELELSEDFTAFKEYPLFERSHDHKPAK
ncbi:DUF2884 family protein [Aliidiomarina sp. Khilg15.8]